MKKPYQIESQRAVKRLEEMAAEGNPTVQMLLPMAQMVGWLRKGMSELVLRAGLELVQLLMDASIGVVRLGRPAPTPHGARHVRDQSFA